MIFGAACSTLYRSTYSRAHRSDFTVYTAAAQAVLDGTNIYEAQNPRGWNYMYLPVFAVAMVPFALVNTFTATLVWYILSVGMIAQSLIVTVRLARRFFPKMRLPDFWLGVLIFVLVAKPLISGIVRGQASILVMYLCIMTIWFYFQNRHWLGGLCLAGSIVLKVFPALLLVYFVLKRRHAFAIATSVWLFVLILVVPSAAFGPRGNLALVQQWMDTIAMPANLPENAGSKVVFDQMIDPHIDRNQSVQAVLIRWMAMKTARTSHASQEPLARKCAMGLNAVLLLFSAAACLRGRIERHDRITLLQLSIIVLLMLFISPVSWVHNYALVMLPGAVALAGCFSPAVGSERRFYAIGLSFYVLGALASFGRLYHHCGAVLWGTIALWIALVWITIETRRENPALDEQSGRLEAETQNEPDGVAARTPAA
jgi:hypothetical protein